VNALADGVRIIRDRYTLNGLSCRSALDEVNAVGCCGFPEATRMRIGFVLLISALLISLCCAGCAFFQKFVAQAPAPQQTAAVAIPAPAAEAAPRFECSDGTISVSQTGCLVNMARARLPPGQPNEPAPNAAH
jgi:hypothetical protein